MTEPDDKTDRMDIPADVELEAPFDEDRTPTPPRTPAMCWRCPSIATFLSATAPYPRCDDDAKNHYDSCSVANDLSWAICLATLMLRFGRFEYYFGPERRRDRAGLAPLRERRGDPPPFPPRTSG